MAPEIPMLLGVMPSAPMEVLRKVLSSRAPGACICRQPRHIPSIIPH